MKHKLLVAIGFYVYSFLLVICGFYLYKNNHIIPMVVFVLFAIMNATFKIESDGEAPDNYNFFCAKVAYIIWFLVKVLVVGLTVATIMLHWYIITVILFLLIIRIEEPVKIYDEV